MRATPDQPERVRHQAVSDRQRMSIFENKADTGVDGFAAPVRVTALGPRSHRDAVAFAGLTPCGAAQLFSSRGRKMKCAIL